MIGGGDGRGGLSWRGRIDGAIGVGVFWFIWGHYGFWWGVLYGLSWPFWVGYKLAAFLVTR